MWGRDIALKAVHWGIHSQVSSGQHARAAVAWTACGVAWWFAAPGVAAAGPAGLAGPAAPVAAIAPDPPRATQPVTVPPGTFAPTWDLDGTYLWLGPVGAASHIDARWDSTFGGEAALVVVREREALSLFGGSFGASRWTARGGGRMWVDGLIGTYLAGRMMGISLGPMVELSELAHPRPGASIGVWAFAGITPFARLGVVADLGAFAEVGVHIALPVLRR